MTFTALVGDCTTTTTLALAAALPPDTLVVEADRTGGSIAAWLDVPNSPSLSAVVANLRATTDDVAMQWATIENLIRTSRSGVRFIPAPVLSTEAARAIDEAERAVFPTIAQRVLALADAGRRSAAAGISATIRLADIVIVCHRQATASASAASVRIERTAELLELLAGRPGRIIVAVIGDQPFDRGEIHDFLADHASTIRTHLLADDPLAAAAIAGRQGVSTSKFARLPLIRSCRDLAALLTDEPLGDEGA